MTVEIYGQRYPISNDYATDTGQTWTWDNGAPDCPECDEPLEKDALDFAVESTRRRGWQVVCAWCGHEMKIEE
jgi:hypothetical protein